MNTSRRFFCTGMSLTVIGAITSMTLSQIAQAQGNVKKRVIPVKVQKFSFVPNRIEATPGEIIVLALSALDFPHGFNMPDFNLRMDLMPGKIINVELKPDKPGEYDFLCDNFCGEGHEGMSGKLIVKFQD
ncbi:cupredoxin domain-containing protein [Undibacterium sp. Ji50W]|uniref:cupredoxin domain-containing protein n=1 Tax=Undibacterium sp. Ji50W TaxID=3413041 RepID=UPI003BF18BD7